MRSSKVILAISRWCWLSQVMICLTVISTIFPMAVEAKAAGVLTFSDIWGGLPTNLAGHAAAFADADGDGLSDFYITYLKNIGTAPDLFFHNTGSGLFSEEGISRGISDTNDGGSHGAAWADLDNDGDYDLLNGSTTPPGFGHDETPLGVHNDIYRNDGAGNFTNVTPLAMLNREKRTRAIIALDWDKDGDLDVFAIQGSKPVESSEVYRNDGDFQFTELTSGGLAGITANQGATDTDYDGDGDVDVLAATRRATVWILKNDGTGNFSVVSPTTIGITHAANDGISTADIDNDGDLDLLLTGDEVGNLYTNNGSGTFTFKQSFASTNGYMGGFGDLDNDGDLDLVFAGDDVSYLNDGTGAFEVGPSIPVSGIGDPRAIGLSDIDNDGDLDFAIGAKGTRSWLIRNNYDSGNFLKIQLVSPDGQAGAFGAKSYVYPAGQVGGTLLGMRESKSNLGYLGQDDPVLHFGLGSITLVDIVVQFLDGSMVTRTSVAANQLITIDPRDATPPTSPTDLTAMVEGQDVNLSWTAASDLETGISSYQIYRDTTSGGEKSLIAQVDGSTLSYLDNSTNPNTTYYFEVSAMNGSGVEGDKSNEASGTTGDVAPAAPANLTGEAGDQQVSLDWEDNSEPDLAGYDVYRSDAPGGPYAKITSSPLTGSSYIDTTVVNQQTYFYVVSAIDAANNASLFSNEVAVTPTVSQLLQISTWKLDEGSGTIAADSAGDNDGTLINGPVWTTLGKIDGALEFDGSDDRVTVLSAPDLEISGPITLSAWVSADTLSRKGDRIISKSNGSGSNQCDYYLMATSSKIEFAFFDGSLIKTTYSVSLTPGQWHQIVGTYDGTTARLYLNGIEVASTVHTGNIRVSTRSLHLGSWGGADLNQTWDGRLDDLRIYAQALTAEEVLSLFNGDL